MFKFRRHYSLGTVTIIGLLLIVVVVVVGNAYSAGNDQEPPAALAGAETDRPAKTATLDETDNPSERITASPNSTCPTDSFGYTCIDSTEPGGLINFEFEDIAGTGTPVSLGDEQVSDAVPVGFSFDYYGTVYTNTYISSNGFISLLPTNNSGCCEGQPIPTQGAPDGMIAGWWVDLFPPAGGTITYQTLGAAPSRYFIVQFTDIQHFPSGNPVTLQYKLFEGSNNIEVHYLNAPSDGEVHSAGIENQNGTVGLQYYLGPDDLPSELAVCYLYPGQNECSNTVVNYDVYLPIILGVPE
jgi:hypothetical protein